MSLLDQFRGSSGIQGAFNKHSLPGDTVAGKVTATDVMQVREYKPDGIGELLFFDDGQPRRQVAITVDTGKTTADDDGLRRIYIRMDYKSQREALLAAVSAAGDDDVQIGGHFAARYEGKPDGWNVYTYEYKKPSPVAGLLGKSEPALTPPQAEQTFAPGGVVPGAPTHEGAPTNASPQDIIDAKALLAQNLPDAVIRQAFPSVSAELLAALRNAG